MISELEFKSLSAQGYNRIPLMAEAFADLETPLSLYLKLAHSKDGGKYSFLLESVVGGERFGRYSFIGLPARTLVRAMGFGADARTEVVTDGVVVAVGRRPVTDGLGLEGIGVKTERGFVLVDRHQKTNVEGIYAIGDVTPGPQLAHKASAEGIVAAEAIAGVKT
ncbi:MAG: FAD-dependent oxidoreductase, partial [Rhodoferax sp.]